MTTTDAIFCILTFTLSGCGMFERTYVDKRTHKPKPDPDSKFASVVLPIIQSSCATAGCHAGGAIVNLENEQSFRASNSLARLENRTMPPAGTKELSEEDRATLLAFLRGEDI